MAQNFENKILEKISSIENKNIKLEDLNKFELFSEKSLKYLSQYYLSRKLNDEEYLNIKKIFSTTGASSIFSKIVNEFKKESQYPEFFNIIISTFFAYPKEKLILEKQNILRKIISKEINKEIKFSKIENKRISIPYQVYVLEEENIKEILNEIAFRENVFVSILELSKEEIMQLTDLTNTIVVSNEIYSNIAISTDEFYNIIKATIYNKNKEIILNLLENIKELDLDLIEAIINFSENKAYKQDEENNPSNLEQNNNKINNSQIEDKLKELEEKEISFEKTAKQIKELNYKLEEAQEISFRINNEIEKLMNEKDITLDAKSLLNALKNNDYSTVTQNFKEDIDKIVAKEEDEIIELLSNLKISYNDFFTNSYPVKVNEENVEEVKKVLEDKSQNIDVDKLIEIGKIFREIEKIMPKVLSNLNTSNIIKIVSYNDFIQTINKTYYEKVNQQNIEEFIFPKINNNLSLSFKKSKNFFFESTPIDFGLKTKDFNLNEEKISILTGANSGGKTTLLELILQTIFLTYMGFPIFAKEANIPLLNKIYYFKKFSGQANAGAFEQTIKNFILAITEEKETEKLILIDEFESITEPDAAAKILMSFLESLNQTKSLCVVVSHLGNELKNYVKSGIRLDGIFARGLDEDNELLTDHQPIFNKRGKSTPELILQKIILDKNYWKEDNQEMKDELKKLIKDMSSN